MYLESLEFLTLFEDGSGAELVVNLFPKLFIKFHIGDTITVVVSSGLFRVAFIIPIRYPENDIVYV